MSDWDDDDWGDTWAEDLADDREQQGISDALDELEREDYDRSLRSDPRRPR